VCDFRQYSANPVFGVSFTVEDTAPSITDLKVPVQQDDIEIVDTEEASHDALAAYYADSSKGSDRYLTSLGCTSQFMKFLHPKTFCSMPFLETSRLPVTLSAAGLREPEFNQHLGLAVEQLKEGVTIEQLWSVL
jgi:hypothetical protein